MRVLGLAGGIDRVDENHYNLGFDEVHDSAAVLVEDGRVVAGIEEERLNRIKHTNKAPGSAIRFCLEQAGVGLDDLDAVAFYATEAYTDGLLAWLHLRRPSVPRRLTARDMLQQVLRQELGREIDPARFRFVHHHRAHAVSAYHPTGWDDALVVTWDGQGEGVSGTVSSGRGRSLELLRSIGEGDSLGFFYRDVVRFLGYEMFDEYKVMGLAPYGDPARFRGAFREIYELEPDGEYHLRLERVNDLLRHVTPRRKGEPITPVHHDLAAALQEALETIGLHVVEHFRRATPHRRLALAGGVAHNCTLNGRILAKGLFDEVFVQPASHDAGCALGAALAVDIEEGGAPRATPLHVYWGSEVGGEEEVARELSKWKDLLAFERSPDVVEGAATLLAEGQVIGWVQERSEFGPRALGHRSILADPRPAANKDRINRMVKKREAYRPFAPSVLRERADEFFVIPGGRPDLPYMTVIVEVRPEKRSLLGAVTHVDGTARIQTVSREASPRYWELIEAFGRRTGVPILLNTSFNNHAEPIVDSLHDAVTCFLTTDLHRLVVGDHLVSKLGAGPAAWLPLRVSLPPALVLRSDARPGARGGSARRLEARFAHDHGPALPLGEDLFEVLSAADGRRSWGELLERAGMAGRSGALLGELRELWSARMVVLRP